MPKQVQKFVNFEGGVNEGSDPRDVADNEVTKADNIVVDDLGLISLIGKVDTEAINEYSSTQIKPGYGLFSYSTDYDSSGNANNTDWVAILNKNDGNVELRHTTSGSTNIINDAIDLGGDDDGTEACFYFADGALRVGQSNLSLAKDTRWYGYINEKFYQTTDGVTSNGTPVSERSAWSSLVAAPQSPNDLNSISLDLHDASSANPDSSTVGSSAGDKVILSYIKTDNGGWNGVFTFGMTFVYKNGGESAMEKCNETIACSDNKLSFQMYIPIGTSDTLAADAGNCLGDDRITSINIWFKEFEAKRYRLLTEFDLLTGGEDHWMKYNSTDDTTKGVFSGSLTLRNTSDSADRPNYTTEDGTAGLYSYANTDIMVKLVNNATGFTGRSGYLRLYGTHVSPLYSSATTNLATGNVTINMTNAGPGTQTLKVELLDESFNILAESSEISYVVVDSGRVPPPIYNANDPNSS